MQFLLAIKTFLLRERAFGGRPPVRVSRRRQRGVALIAVMVAIAITLVIAQDFGTSTNVDMIAAANYRDQMRAHFLARSAVNLSELVIRLQKRLDNIKELGGVRITEFADQMLLAFCGSPEEVQAAIGLSSADVKGLGADIGTCGIVGQQITTDDDKINVNCGHATKPVADSLRSTLYALFYFPAYDPVFEEADAEGYRRDRVTQASAIVDYIDGDSAGSQLGTSEQYGYENLKDPYKPKNNIIDSLGELRQVRGVDDRFWSLFGSSFTSYGGCKVNLTTLSNPQIISGLLTITAKNQNDPVLLDPVKLYALSNVVAKAKMYGVTFSKPADFIEFVKDPTAKVSLLAGQSGTLQGSAAQRATTNGSLFGPAVGNQKIGLELDAQKLGQITSTGPLRTYRVQAYGEIERKQKMADGSPVFPAIRSTITGVWDTNVVPQNSRKPGAPRGAWVFLRED